MHYLILNISLRHFACTNEKCNTYSNNNEIHVKVKNNKKAELISDVRDMFISNTWFKAGDNELLPSFNEYLSEFCCKLEHIFDSFKGFVQSLREEKEAVNNVVLVGVNPA